MIIIGVILSIIVAVINVMPGKQDIFDRYLVSMIILWFCIYTLCGVIK